MSERLRRIELAVNIPGPKGIDDQLDQVEAVFLQKKFGHQLVDQINQGHLWQNY